jgi:hypothetical protein
MPGIGGKTMDRRTFLKIGASALALLFARKTPIASGKEEVDGNVYERAVRETVDRYGLYAALPASENIQIGSAVSVNESGEIVMAADDDYVLGSVVSRNGDCVEVML